MTTMQLISDRYHRRHTREGGYPVFKTTFYDSINIERQSRLSNQIEIEFMVLKFLKSQGIAPKASHFDNSKKNFDILIEEYLETQL